MENSENKFFVEIKSNLINITIIVLIIIAILVNVLDFNAEEIDYENINKLSGEGVEEINDIIEVEDENYIITSKTNSRSVSGEQVSLEGDYDAFVTKINSDGEMLWNLSIASKGYDNVNKVIESEGYYFVVGETTLEDLDGSIAFLKILDTDGNIIKEYYDEIGLNSKINDIIYLGDYDYLFVVDVYDEELEKQVNVLINFGYYLSYYYEELQVELNWYYEFTNDAKISYLFSDEDGYVAVGNRLNYNKNYDAYAVKFDEDGEIVWSINTGGASDDVINNAIQADNGNYVAVGYSASEKVQGGGQNIKNDIKENNAYILIFSEDGKIIKSYLVGDAYNLSNNYNKVIEVDDQYIAVGEQYNSYGFSKLFYTKFNEEKIFKEKEYNTGTNIVYVDEIFEKDGKYYLFGKYQSDDMRSDEMTNFFDGFVAFE